MARSALALVLVALGAAAFAMAFRAAVSAVYGAVFHAHDVLELFRELPVWMRVLVPVVGALFAGLVVRRASKAAGHSVGAVMEAIVLGTSQLSVRATAWKALGSWLAITTGSSVGREGPLIQFGGSLGFRIGTVLDVGPERRATLVAAGTAAGFAAAYNTPLAAVLFVVEVMGARIALGALAPVLVATAVATAVVRATVGAGPIYRQRAFAVTSIAELVAHALLGIAAAVVAQAFMRLLAAGERGFARSALPQPLRACAGALVVGLLATRLPEVTGNGYEPLNLLLDRTYAPVMVATLLVAKTIATTASVGSGAPGGVFTPSLLVGGATGLLWGHAVAPLVGAPGSEGGYALVGMAAVIAATTHAPLMASVLVFELSGDYAIVLPLVLATAVATSLSRRMRADSIYTAELRERGAAFRRHVSRADV